MPPAFLNHRVPTAGDTPASTAAASLATPAAIAAQNRRRSSRPATGGRPGENRGARPDRSERRFRADIATSSRRVLRRPLESALATLVGIENLEFTILGKRRLDRLKAEIDRQGDRHPPGQHLAAEPVHHG